MAQMPEQAAISSSSTGNWPLSSLLFPATSRLWTRDVVSFYNQQKEAI